jgi:arylsulfatase A-like enzyme
VQAQEVASNPGQAFADFVGIGIHCAAGDPLCSSANTGEQDLLPDEPGGYAGYNALYGNKYVAPQISPNGPMTDLNGNVIQDPQGHIGFPGFDGMAAAVSLAYVAAMQEHGVPITYAYISDAHDSHSGGGAFGPGAAGYVAALKAYDDAFNKFFTRLAADGIAHDNTLFIFTSDEGDHFAGGPPSPANCDGVTVPCTYAKIGEINGNLAGLLATEQGITTPFKVHSDDAPTIYITGNPVRTDPVARGFARDLDKLTAVSPISGNTDKISQFLADAVEMKILHMVTADPARTPSLVMFGDPDYFLFAGAPNCNSPCVTENPGFAWNHGDVQPEIVTTWLGMVGPGVGDDGVDGETWSDHTDIRPTIMLLTGLKDDYGHDGRVLSEELAGSALPSSMRGNGNIFRKLAQSYKQINACVGQFGLGTLRMSNSALSSNDPGDATYNQLENNLANLNAQRDSLASQMIQILEDAAFNGKTIDRAQASSLIRQANQLLQQVPQ